MITIYDKKITKGGFDNNGLAVLNECIKAETIEKLNDDYSLTIIYPLNSKKIKYFEMYNIVKADNQLFRIYKIEKTKNYEDKSITVYARHIFYDAEHYFIPDSRAVNCSMKTALQKALDGAEDASGVFEVNSDVITANTLYIVEDNLLTSIFKIIERWNSGELTRDNFKITVNQNKSSDKGKIISYRKNIIGVTLTTDGSENATKIYCKGKNGIKLPEQYINVPNLDNTKLPPFPLIKIQEFDAEDILTLRAMATEYVNNLVFNSINISVDFMDLSSTDMYEKFKQLEMVEVGEICTVKCPDIGIDFKQKVISITKNVLKNKNIKVELGQPIKSLGDSTKNIQTTVDDLGNKVENISTSQRAYENSTDLTISTIEMQPVYLGVSANDNTNLIVYFNLHCVSDSKSTLTIKIKIDDVFISFNSKQVLEIGDNIINWTPFLPYVTGGSHYISVYLSVNTGTATVAKHDLQLVIDGKALLGGLSAEPPHAEIAEYQDYVDLNVLFADYVTDTCDTDIQIPIVVVGSEYQDYVDLNTMFANYATEGFTVAVGNQIYTGWDILTNRTWDSLTSTQWDDLYNSRI